MHKIGLILSLPLCFAIFGCTVKSAQNPDSQSGRLSVEHKVDSVLSLMTIDEKIGQLNQYSIGPNMTGPGAKTGTDSIRYVRLLNGEVGSVLNLLGAEETYKLQKLVVENSRLGIPLMFGFDVVHGYKTMYPIPLGESASWDLEAIKKAASIAAEESTSAGINWTFAPMVDISRDARWGRVMEGAGEDTYLGSKIAEARVKGFQGENLNGPLTMAACAKHFAGYGFVESGKDYNNVYIGKSTLLNTIIPPFEAASDAGVASFMNAFNDIDGVPSTGNPYLLHDLLKNKWGFNGLVVSDWNSIGEMVTHGTSSDLEEAALHAINAGTDVDMEGDAYSRYLKGLIESGSVEMPTIDDAVRRVLRVKFELGLFDNPYLYCDTLREEQTLYNQSNRNNSRDMARKSIVLLKNENQLLPLESSKKIGIIGPLAKDKDSPLGNWRAAAVPGTAVSMYEGMRDAWGKDIPFAEGCKLSIGPNNFFDEIVIEKTDRSGFKAAKEVAKSVDIVLMVLGETAYMSGEGRSRSEIGLPGLQLDLLKEVYSVNKNIVLVLMNGRPLAIPWEAEHIPAIVETWHLGSEAGHAISDVLTGEYNPSGKLPMTFPRSVGQVPIYYNHKNSGRPSTAPGQVFYTHHTDIDNSPLYPFGYGLSYSTFNYSDLRLDKKNINTDETLMVSVNVENTSNADGDEVVQLYIQDVVASITRPVKELKGFKKVHIKAGESTRVEFNLNSSDLAFYRADFSYGIEPGDFRVFVGGNSRDVLESEFKLLENNLQ